MNSRQYPPSTPRRSRRGLRGSGRGSRRGSSARNAPPLPQTRRGTPRANRFRRVSRRNREGSYANPTRRCAGCPRTPFESSSESYDEAHAGGDTSGWPLSYGAGPKIATYSPKAQLSDDDGLLIGSCQKMLVVSPNARKQSFSEIMHGAFDLKKSPRGLGRRLAEAAVPSFNSQKLYSPFGVLYPSRGNSLSGSPTPTRPGKRDASSQMGPVSKHTKSSHERDHPFGGFGSGPAANTSAIGNKTGSVTVGFTTPQQPTREQTPELAHLLEMVQQNMQRSKELSDMVTDYIYRHPAGPQETAPIAAGQTSFLSQDANCKTLLSVPHHASAIACGGDSPDPPRDNLNYPRAHMIDKSDISSKSPHKSREHSCDGARDVVRPYFTDQQDDNWETDEDGNDDYSCIPEAWDYLLPRQMGALDLRSAANDHEDLTRIRHGSSSGQASTASSSRRKAGNDHANSLAENPSLRWRTCYAPSPDTVTPIDLGSDTAQWPMRPSASYEHSLAGKTPSRAGSSPGVYSKMSPIKTPASSLISIHLDACSSGGASYVLSPDCYANSDIKPGDSDVVPTPGIRSPHTP